MYIVSGVIRMNTLKTILVIFFLSIGVACDQADPKSNYSEFDHIDHWDDVYALSSEKTIIYYYSPFCDTCISLQEEVTNQLDELEEYYDVFLIDEAMIYERGEQPAEVMSVPSIILVSEGEVDEIIKGSIPVLEYLEQEMEKIK